MDHLKFYDSQRLEACGLWRCNDKSDLFSGLADKSTTLDFPKNQDSVVNEGMGFINHLRITAEIGTLDSLAVQFGNKIRAETDTYGGVVLIFDRYDDSHQNLKN